MFILTISLHLTMTSLLPLLHHNWPFQLLYKISPLIMGRHHCVQFCYLEHEDSSIFMGRMESWKLKFHRFDSKKVLSNMLSCKGLFYTKLVLHWNIKISFFFVCSMLTMWLPVQLFTTGTKKQKYFAPKLSLTWSSLQSLFLQ